MNVSKQIIVMVAIALLFTLNSGKAQTNKREIYSHVYNEVVDLVVNAFNDSSINIALCKSTGNYAFSATENGVSRLFSPANNYSQIISDLEIGITSVIEELRGDIDSLIFVRAVLLVDHRSLPAAANISGSEWILFLENPFDHSHRDNTKLLEKFEQLNGKALLNSNNFFNLYEHCYGGVCIDWPEDRDFSPMFIYSKGLIDDFKTIIKLQDNPSLLSESDDSYDTYYSSLKDDLGKRVFSRLFDNPNQE